MSTNQTAWRAVIEIWRDENTGTAFWQRVYAAPFSTREAAEREAARIAEHPLVAGNRDKDVFRLDLNHPELGYAGRHFAEPHDGWIPHGAEPYQHGERDTQQSFVLLWRSAPDEAMCRAENPAR